jgi:ketosteroid isomerase-like protein
VVTKSATAFAIMVSLSSCLVAQNPKALADSLTHEWVVAYNAGQPDRLAELVRDDVLLMLPGRDRIRGRAAFRDAYAEDIKETTKRRIFTSSIRVEQSGDLLVDTGQWNLDGTLPDGTTLHLAGSYVSVWKRTNGQWKTAIDISNRR